jgi:hypothetical protein
VYRCALAAESWRDRYRGPVTGTCESCGREDEPLVHVRRYYVTPEAWDTPGKVEPAGTEWWCFSCRTHYPHEPIDEPVGDG